MAAFLGMRGTGDWDDDARPQSWNETMFKLFPNGEVTLTGILGMVGTERITDIQHNWKTRTLSAQAGAVTSVYIDSALGTEYVYATHQATYGIAGKTVYAKVAEATAKMFVENMQVVLTDTDRPSVDVVGKVTSVTLNGASSVIGVKLHEADDNDSVSATYNLASVDRIRQLGSVHSLNGSNSHHLLGCPQSNYRGSLLR